MRTMRLIITLLSLLFVFYCGCAFEYRVGGKVGWVEPREDDIDTQYDTWAPIRRFQVGDSLLFVYQRGKDSVLLVTESAYNDCNTTDPISYSYNGNSVFRFDMAGAYFFISGNKESCSKGQKVEVVVMGPRDWSSAWHMAHAYAPPRPSSSPSPSPTPSSPSPTPSSTSPTSSNSSYGAYASGPSPSYGGPFSAGYSSFSGLCYWMLGSCMVMVFSLL